MMLICQVTNVDDNVVGSGDGNENLVVVVDNVVVDNVVDDKDDNVVDDNHYDKSNDDDNDGNELIKAV